MRRFLLALSILAVLAGGSVAGFPPAVAHAQNAVTSTQHPSLDESACPAQQGGCTRTNGDGSTTACGGALGSNSSCKVTFPNGSYTTIQAGSFAGQDVKNYDANGTLVSSDLGADSNALVHQTTGPQTNYNVDNSGAPVGSIFGKIAGGLVSGLLDAIAFLVIGFSHFLLGIAGVLLNWVLIRTVFQFSVFLGNSQGVLAAWGVLRDIGNLLILFGFIFMGLATVLELQNYSMKKALPGLIIFAVCLNFSLFAADAVIDVSNVFSSVLYTQASASPCTDPNACAMNGLAGHIMQSSGLSAIFDYQPQSPGDLVDKIIVIITLAFFSLIGAVVLLAMAIMLLIRAVVLVLIMVTSPIGFAGWAIPPLRKAGKDWWGRLIHQAFYAPIMLLLVFISLKITDAFSGGAGNGSLANGVTSLAAALQSPDVSTMSVVMLYALAMAFMIASLITANKFGAVGAKFATETATKITFGAGNLATQGSARFGRFAIQRSPLATTKFGKAAIGTLRYGEEGWLDPRKIKPVEGILKQAGAGKAAGAQDSYKKTTEAWDTFKPGGKRAKEEQKKQEEELRGVQFSKDKASLSAALKAKKLDHEHEQFLAKLGTKDLEKVSEIKKGDATLAKALSPDQFDGLMKGDGLTDTEKNALAKARFEDVLTRDKTAVRQMSNKDLQQLAKSDDQTFTDLVRKGELSDDQLETLVKGDSLTASQKNFVRTQTSTGKVEAAVEGGDLLTAQNLAAALTSKRKAKLSSAALTSGDAVTGVLATLRPTDLQQIMDADTIDQSTKQVILSAINDTRHVNHAELVKYVTKNPVGKIYWK